MTQPVEISFTETAPEALAGHEGRVALVLTGLMSLRGTNTGWREGLLWGVAGFAAVMLAPMIGLPPEWTDKGPGVSAAR